MKKVFISKDQIDVILKLNNPGILMNKKNGIIYKIDEHEKLLGFYKKTKSNYQSCGMNNYVDNIVLINFNEQKTA